MSIMRIGGIASGLDTDSIVRDLMRVERMRVDKLFQQRQILDWKKEQFRNITNNVRSFRDTHFNILKPDSNLMSPAALNKIQVNSDHPEIAAITAGPTAALGETKFQVIQSAERALATSSGVTSIRSTEDIGAVTVSEGKNFLTVNLNGNTQEIIITAGDYSQAGLEEELRGKINEAFGENKIQVNLSDNKIEFAPSPVSATKFTDTLVISSSTYYNHGVQDEEDILASLKIANGASNRLNMSDTMETMSQKLKNGPFNFQGDNGFDLEINGETFIISKTDTLRTVIDRINNSNAGVQMSYSSFSDTFTVTARETEEGFIKTNDGGSFFTALNIEVTEGKIGESGRNAIFEINDFRAERSSNTFTIDGLTYSIQGKIDSPSEIATISTSIDVDSIYSVIENFVESYNQLIDEIHGKLGEERFREFKPLTDEQMDAMSDRDIEKWEEKAQSGLLRRDSTLENMMRNLRTTLYEQVGSFHLSEIGIVTSSNYQDNGKLVLKNGGQDLKAAIASNPGKVSDIFTRRSEISYSADLTADNRAQRHSESGLAHRLSDILNDNIRTTRDQSGRKGLLLEKAGIEGDISQFNNYYERNIQGLNQQIGRVNEILYRKEEQYYRQFAAMEKALQQLYAQGDWLMMQMAQFNQ